MSVMWSVDVPKDLPKIPTDDLYQIAVSVISELRSRGYAVITWTPGELKGANAHRVEDRSVELGWEIINDLKDPACPACGEPRDDNGVCNNKKCQIYGGGL